jgi:deazaflavin-dependent oxidoreductase (nitroreductase family)
MHLPRFMRRVNRVFTNRIMGTFAWFVPPLAVVHHVGRKSGQRYRTPVVAFRTAAGFVIPMTYGRDVDWARNLVRAHGGEIEKMGERFMLRNPRIVGFKAAESHLPAAARPLLRVADFPGYVLLDLDTERSRRSGKHTARSKQS